MTRETNLSSRAQNFFRGYNRAAAKEHKVRTKDDEGELVELAIAHTLAVRAYALEILDSEPQDPEAQKTARDAELAWAYLLGKSTDEIIQEFGYPEGTRFNYKKLIAAVGATAEKAPGVIGTAKESYDISEQEDIQTFVIEQFTPREVLSRGVQKGFIDPNFAKALVFYLEAQKTNTSLSEKQIRDLMAQVEIRIQQCISEVGRRSSKYPTLKLVFGYKPDSMRPTDPLTIAQQRAKNSAIKDVSADKKLEQLMYEIASELRQLFNLDRDAT